MNKRSFIGIVMSLLMLNLVGCRTATMIDLIHKETDMLKVTDDVMVDSKFNKYRVGGTLFKPFIERNPQELGQGFSNYSLILNVYKMKKDNSKVTVNNIKILGSKKVDFKGVDIDLTSPIEFTEDRDNPSILVSNTTVIEEIYKGNMKLNEDSLLTVSLTVTVEVNGKKITKDLTYEFETLIRTYAIQR
ncbi:hypothetical protein FZW96_16575 [Bacillus sp. BGMRC 2118]|nr:hypothetical protein FZW96_16575 [Bacillus sp. BGMRC 2118]